MFIKEIVKKNPTSDKTFISHRLMESVRTPRGPRHRKILNLGKLDIPKEDWKTLANRIVDYRQQNGPFKNINELIKVDGIGVNTYDRIKYLITVAD